MLTPQEIQEMKFEKAVFGGYDMAQIDKFLDELLVDYTLLYKENAALKGKMRVLVDKIEEYRAVDEEMRKALYTAQNTAKDIIDKANAEAKVIIAEADAEAKRKADNIERETYATAVKLRELRDICSRYAQTVRALMDKAAADISLTEDKNIDELIEKTLVDSAYLKKVQSFEIDIPEPIIDPKDSLPAKPEVEEPTLEIQVDGESIVAQDEDPDKVFDINLIREIAEDDTSDRYEDDEDTEEDDDYDEDIEEGEDDCSAPPTTRFKFDFADLKFGKNYKNND